MSEQFQTPPWLNAIKVFTKKGKKVLLMEMMKAPEGLEDVDFLKPAYLYEKPISHELLLLSISAERYPVIIEQMMKKMKEVVSR